MISLEATAYATWSLLILPMNHSDKYLDPYPNTVNQLKTYIAGEERWRYKICLEKNGDGMCVEKNGDGIKYGWRRRMMVCG